MNYEVVNSMAARICGIKPALEQPNKQSTVPKGNWYEYQHQDSEGVVIDCYLEYEKAHNGGTGPDSDESYPESIELAYALVNGVDIAEVLCDDVKKIIEEKALASMEMDKWNSDYDKGEERHNDKEFS